MSARLKSAAFSAGHYRRRLEQDRFPGVAVLCYHAIRPDEWPGGRMAFEGLHVRASEFEAHCRLLQSTCHPITLASWRAALDGGPPLPDRAVLITFDDGYRTVATVAHPILERFGLPAVLFACSAPMEERTLFWHDAVARCEGEAEAQRLKAAPYDKWCAAVGAVRTSVTDDDPHAPLRVEELSDLARQRFEIGGHTATHPILARASGEHQRNEIRRNRQAICAWTGQKPAAFAYPNGERSDYTSETMAMLTELSYTLAFTTEAGFASAERPLECQRFLMLAGVSEAELAHRLSYSWRSKTDASSKSEVSSLPQ